MVKYGARRPLLSARSSDVLYKRIVSQWFLAIESANPGRCDGARYLRMSKMVGMGHPRRFLLQLEARHARHVL
jgi:hypothetical protein